MATYTVVVWDEGDVANDACVRPVGPTSEDAQLLRGTLDKAREKYAGAEIVTWGCREHRVSQVQAHARAMLDERETIDRLMDQH